MELMFLVVTWASALSSPQDKMLICRPLKLLPIHLRYSRRFYAKMLSDRSKRLAKKVMLAMVMLSVNMCLRPAYPCAVWAVV